MYTVLDIPTSTSVDERRRNGAASLPHTVGWVVVWPRTRSLARLKKDGVGCAVHTLHMWEVAGTTTVVSLPDKLTLPRAVPFVPYWPVPQACDRV